MQDGFGILTIFQKLEKEDDPDHPDNEVMILEGFWKENELVLGTIREKK